MIAHQIQSVAELAIGRVLNSLPEGLLVAAFAWTVLRILPKQNSRTRFAVWFVALLAVAGVPFLGGLRLTVSGILPESASKLNAIASAITLPAHWATFLLAAWLIAAFIAMARVGASIVRLWDLRRTCTPIDTRELDPALSQTLSDTIAELNRASGIATRQVRLATSDQMRVPAALGLWHPMIVLPKWTLQELSLADLSIILRHEFAHLRRWDDWTNLIQKVVRALFFFHPAVWWIENRLSIEREMACDDVVVAQTDNPMGYASCLISLLERSLAQRGWAMAQAIVHRAREASIRVAQILDKNRPSNTALSKPALGLVGVFTLLCVVMVPNTPQFVAFNSDRLPAADRQYSASQGLTGLQHSAMLRTSYRDAGGAAVVPASFHRTEPPAKLTKVVKKVAPAVTQAATVRRDADRDIAAELVASSEPGTDSLQAAAFNMQSALAALMQGTNVIANQNIRPMTPTLVFFQATQFTTAEDEGSSETPSGATLWRVQVWRVTLTDPNWERRVRVPVASKT